MPMPKYLKPSFSAAFLSRRFLPSRIKLPVIADFIFFRSAFLNSSHSVIMSRASAFLAAS